MTARRAAFIRQIVLIGVIAAGAIVFWQFEAVRGIFDEIVIIVKELITKYPALGAAAFIGLALIAAMFSSISTIPLIPVATAVWGAGLTALFLLVGWMAGDVVAYALGAYAGHPLARHFFSAARLKRWEGHFERGTTFLPATLFKMTTPAETGYLFGAFRYPMLHYLAISVIANTPVAIVSAYASRALIEGRMLVFWIILGAAAATAVGTLIYFRVQRPAKFHRAIAFGRRAIGKLFR